MSFAILIGDRHGGKSGTCLRLADEARRRGVSVGGIVSRASFEGDVCVGYDVVDLGTGHETVLARLDEPGVEQVGRFGFLADGLDFGRAALGDALARSARLIIADEVGRLELAGGGWAAQIEQLTEHDGVILLTARRSHAEDVIRRWCHGRSPAQESNSPLVCDLEQGPDAAIDAALRLLTGPGDARTPRCRQ